MTSSVTGHLRRLRNGLSKHAARLIVPKLVRIQAGSVPLTMVGEGDGAWPVPEAYLTPDWVCYCVGVGVNATFDVSLAREYGCDVVSIDPTPRSIAYMDTLDYPADRLQFVPLGVWKTEETMRFFAPANRAHANWSVVDLHGTGEYFTAECKRLSVIMRELGHDHVDLLKLDIEGSWAAVIDSILAEDLLPTVLCVEFDSPVSLPRLVRYTRRLRQRGLQVAYQHKENFVFVNQLRLTSQETPAGA